MYITHVGECAGGCGGGRRREMDEGILQKEISIALQMARSVSSILAKHLVILIRCIYLQCIVFPEYVDHHSWLQDDSECTNAH